MDVGSGTRASLLLQAQAHVWNHTMNFVNSMALKCAVRLGIPDAINNHGQPITLSELVTALSINPIKAPCLHRLMRVLVHSGFFAQQQADHNEQEQLYSLTYASRFLLKDEPTSGAPLLLVQVDPHLTNPCHFLSDWFRNSDPTPFVTAYGKPFWDYAAHEPKFNNFFNEAMASDSQLIASVVVGECKEVFRGLSSLIDVGGGTGTMAKVIAKAFPHLKCTVFDQPHVVANLQGGENLEFVGGDIFEAIPPADAILLKSILHNWSDGECVKILKKCKEAIHPRKDKGGKVIIIDMVMENNKGDEAVEAQLFYDILMMVVVAGKERNEREWENLFLAAGFAHYKITSTLGPRSLIEVYP
ncbi:trans-resveratrol di-O-methyltransferase-like [Vitis riparia]|uniref:trans-resveratrol di-O-methyltransferase-like n=1 Tax=Vitis riparia TaxID=96939 RepID=UPI00155A4099|nr:trans-resveratrol di-O-methyltransferase-like [Vitis riparia]